MARKDRATDPTEIQRSIEEAIQDFVRKGLVVDSGQGGGLNGLADMKSRGNTSHLLAVTLSRLAYS